MRPHPRHVDAEATYRRALAVEGEIAAVPIVRLADLGCAALNQGPVEELGVWVDEGALRPKVLLLDGSAAARVARATTPVSG